MRAEVKAGLIVGLVAIAVGGIWWFSRPTNELGELQIDKATMDATSEEGAGLASETVPRVREPDSADRPSQAEIDKPAIVTPAAQQPAGGGPSASESEVTPASPDTATPGAEPEAGKVDESAAGKPEVLEPTGPEDLTAAELTPPRRREPVSPPTGPQPRPGVSTPPRQAYTIQPGDRLIDLALYEYGDGDLWKSIKAVNPGIDENRLQIGAEIQIPSLAEALRLAEQAAAPPTPAQPGLKPAPEGAEAGQATYVVGPGDSLIKIARNVLNDESRWEEIYELNRDQLESPDMLYVGTELRLPPLEKKAPDKPTEED
jgi:nucleoid-associated protein YgaU